MTPQAEAQALAFAEQRGWISAAERAQAQATGSGAQLLGSLAGRLPPADAESLRAVYARAASGRHSAEFVQPAQSSRQPVGDDSATIQPSGFGAAPDDSATLRPSGFGAAPDDSATIQPSASGAPERAPSPQPVSGRRLGPYTLIRELARGGMGAVWIARRPDLDREVALKVLLSGAGASEGEVERFLTEARISARLRHPAIVSVLDVGQEGGRHYLAMDLIQGGSLKERLGKGPLAPREAAELFLPLAEGLAFAHAQAVLHRDLKPHNVLIDASGQPLLTDFGLAKDTGASQGLTKTGQVMGTPAYMPPEQAEGQSDLIDRRSDVYGLGATLYEALVGEPPFRGSTPLNVIHAVLTKDPAPLRSQVPAIPRDLETIVLTCLEKEPAARYPSALALADDLRAFLAHEPIAARPPTLRDRLRKWRRRHPTLATLAAATLVLGGAGGVGGVIWTSRAEVAARSQAQAQLASEAEADHQRLLAAAGEGSGQGALLNTQSAFAAAQRWQALAPGDPEVYEALRHSVTELQDAACAAREWQTARHANEQLSLLAERESVPDAVEAELKAFVSERAEVVAAAEAGDLSARSREVRAGLLARRPVSPGAEAETRDQVLVWLVRQGPAETRAALLGLGEEFVAALVRAQRRFYEGAFDPARGQALQAGLEAWLGGPRPGAFAQLLASGALDHLVLAQRDLGAQSSAYPDIQRELAQAFPRSEPGALLELVCLGIGHLLGGEPEAVELLTRLALVSSASPHVEHPLRGLLAARAPSCVPAFKAAILLSGGSRGIPVDVFEGFAQTYDSHFTADELTPGDRGQRINQAAKELRAGRLSQALHLLEGLPDDNARLVRGATLLRLGLGEGALGEFNQAGRASTSNLAHEQRAEAWRLLGCHQLALDDAVKAIAANPKDAQAWRVRASVELDLFKLVEARASIRRLLTLRADDPKALGLAVTVTRRLGDLERAQRLLDDAFRQHPSHAILLVAQARVHLAARDAGAARRVLSELRALPKGKRAHPGQLLELEAHALAVEGDLAQAGRKVREALTYGPELEALMLWAHLEPKNPAATNALLLRYPAAYFGHYQIARQRAAKHDYQSALDRMSAILWLRPREASARRERVRLALALRACDLALADLERLPSADRDQPTWHVQRTAGLRLAKRPQEALSAVQAARQRWPENQRLAVAEAKVLRDLERLPEARAILEGVVAGSGPAEDKEEASRMLRELR